MQKALSSELLDEKHFLWDGIGSILKVYPNPKISS
jgi:hypothetical protein